MGLSSTSESLHEAEVGAHWFPAPTLRLRPSPAVALCSLPSASPARSTRFARAILACRWTPFRVLLSSRLAPLLQKGRLSWVPGSSSAPFDGPATCPGFHPRVSLPRPRFLPAFAAILPACQSRACFIPEALLRFTLQGFPLERRLGSFPRPSCPLAVTTVATAISWRVSGTTPRGLDRLQGFALRSSPFSFPRPVKSLGWPFPS